MANKLWAGCAGAGAVGGRVVPEPEAARQLGGGLPQAVGLHGQVAHQRGARLLLAPGLLLPA
eukprot:205436-Prorocentrum_minimum.AAC.1